MLCNVNFFPRYEHILSKTFTEISSSFLLDVLSHLPTDDCVLFLRQTKLRCNSKI